MNSVELIKNWMQKTKSLSFFLPDGPYGRPFDNQYFFLDAAGDEYGLSIKLSHGITFVFFGSSEVTKEDDKLMIRRFDRFDFMIKDKLIKSFIDGEVCLCKF
jgi:hypothetical protein